MPEGDTVYRTARALSDVLAGQVLDRCDIRVPVYATVDLSGERVESVVSVGKHLLHRIGGFTIHSHLGMDGRWDVYRDGARWRNAAWQARAILGVPGVQTVGFLLSELEVLPRERENEFVGYLGPDILGPAWDPALAVGNLSADPDRPIGLALLDQRVIAGLGNVYRNEVCFLRGILPTRAVGTITDLDGMVDLAHRLIVANRDRGDRVTTGDARPGHRTWVHGRERQPCLRCGTPIRRGALGDNELTERGTFYCVVCQR